METVDRTSALERARAELAVAQRLVDAAEMAVHDAQRQAQEAHRQLDEIAVVVRWLDGFENIASREIEQQRQTKAAHASNFAEAYVRKNGPAVIADLHKAYIDAGNNLAGADEAAEKISLSGFLNREQRLKYYKDHGRWWLANEPYPLPKGGDGPPVGSLVIGARPQGTRFALNSGSGNVLIGSTPMQQLGFDDASVNVGFVARRYTTDNS